MATEVIVSLPDNVYTQAARLAHLMNRDVSRLLAETLVAALQPLGPVEVLQKPVRDLLDKELLATADLRMEESQGRRLGRLLDRQGAGDLRESERVELAALMQVYNEGLVRKAQAIAEAVRRGLREPLEP